MWPAMWHGGRPIGRRAATRGSALVFGRSATVALDKSILDMMAPIQKLPDEDKNCIMYSIDGLIQTL